MKKIILIVCTVVVTFSLTAFGYMSWSNNITEHEVQSTPESYRDNSYNPDYNFVNLTDKQAKPDFYYDIDSRF